MMFEKCDFILGENDSIVIVVPGQLPKGLPLTLEIHSDMLLFRSGENAIGGYSGARRDVIQRLMGRAKVGLIEFLNGVPSFPAYITAVAEVAIIRQAAAA